MRLEHIFILLVILVLSAGPCFAQVEELTKIHTVEENADKIVVIQANGERDDAVRFIWQRDPAKVHDFVALSRDGIFPAAKLTDVLRTMIGGYLDVQIKFGGDGVKSDLVAARLADEMEIMVNALLQSTSLRSPDFSFSAGTKDGLARLTNIDWSNTAYALEGDPSEDKYVAIYKFVRVQREALEQSIESDLKTFDGLWVEKQHVTIANSSDATVCGTVFDEDKYLCALDLKVDQVMFDGPEPGLALTIVSESQIIPDVAPTPPSVADEKPVKVRKRDRWLRDELTRLNERMDKIDNTKEVLAVRDRIDVIEDRLSSIEDELEEVKRRPAQYDNPIENLGLLTGKNVTIRFHSGSTKVAPEYMVLLNEVFEHLARSPDQRILITGYSDKSGSAAKNLRLSELRAKSVRAQLLMRGINSDRVLVNFYGDSKSSKVDATERRVEIEWLRP